MFKKIYWFLIITLFVINASVALADVTYSIVSPANLVAGGDPGEILININTGGDTVAGTAFTLTPSDVAKLTLINPQPGTFNVNLPNFNCNMVDGALVCTISGLNGNSGSGSLVTVQATVPEDTAAGDITLTLSGLSADDDLGDPLALAPVNPSTITIEADVCNAVPATPCTAGVSCPGNGVLPATGCPEGEECNDANACVAAPTCNDNIKNQGETGVDCGGPCDACPETCNDGIKNQDETGVDCGGGCVAGCDNGDDCRVGSDCINKCYWNTPNLGSLELDETGNYLGKEITLTQIDADEVIFTVDGDQTSDLKVGDFDDIGGMSLGMIEIIYGPGDDDPKVARFYLNDVEMFGTCSDKQCDPDPFNGGGCYNNLGCVNHICTGQLAGNCDAQGVGCVEGKICQYDGSCVDGAQELSPFVQQLQVFAGNHPEVIDAEEDNFWDINIVTALADFFKQIFTGGQ